MPLIVIEGPDGCGKTTQSQMLMQRFSTLGETAKSFREPGATPIGEKIRELLLDPGNEINPHAELMLFNAARAQLWPQIRFHMYDSTVVLDRFILSTLVYQGILGGVSVELAKKACYTACPGLWDAVHDDTPDIRFFLLDTPEDIRRSRMDGHRLDRMELNTGDNVAAAYDELTEHIAHWPGYNHIKCEDRTPEDIHEEIWGVISE